MWARTRSDPRTPTPPERGGGRAKRGGWGQVMRRRPCPPPGALRAPPSPRGARMARAGGGMEREASARHKTSAVLVVAAVFGCVPFAARADPVADFYRGRQINLILSADVGGGYASYANAFAPYFASHVPGKPQVVVQNMPGRSEERRVGKGRSTRTVG